jgi:hypothetical protein
MDDQIQLLDLFKKFIMQIHPNMEDLEESLNNDELNLFKKPRKNKKKSRDNDEDNDEDYNPEEEDEEDDEEDDDCEDDEEDDDDEDDEDDDDEDDEDDDDEDDEEEDDDGDDDEDDEEDDDDDELPFITLNCKLCGTDITENKYLIIPPNQFIHQKCIIKHVLDNNLDIECEDLNIDEE